MTQPDFRSPAMLRAHIRHTLAFYHPRAIDPSGGCYHFFKDDGRIYDAHSRHLVSSTRFVFNYAMAWRAFGEAEYLDATRHALRFVREVHRREDGGYSWLLHWEDGAARELDHSNHCYGLAFVLLAYAHGLMAGIEEARDWLYETYQLLEQHFWQADFGLYADEADKDWQLSDYRGQNANMHACEAMLAAFEATADPLFLQRAQQLAHGITVERAALAGGRIWEHYHADWTPDWDYNRHDKSNIFRPWGFQPGHFTEWAKLLLILDRHAPADWLLPRARQLFDDAWQHSWDQQHGGMVYGFGPDSAVCDGDKYFWVQAESLAAAAVLAQRSGDAAYWQHYQALWQYSWDHLVDHRHGAWYRILSQDNRAYSDEKSPAGKTDYHTMGACYEVLNVLEPAR